MTYTKQPQTPSYRHPYCISIATMNGKNGEKHVAVVLKGGYSPKLTVWNPNDGSVETLISNFIDITGMVSVNRGEELIMYRNYDYYGGNGIYKYVRSINYYTHIGQLLNPRTSTVVLPVTGMSCP